MKKKVIATIEARMGSSRLAGKMALELYPDLPALGAVVKRLKVSKRLNGVVVATTKNKSDAAIVDISKKFGVMCFRGSEDDVLGRVVGAGKLLSADILVLVTGDCSCISPSLIDEGIDFFLKNSYDLVSNCFKNTYPIGIDLQVVSFSALSKAYALASKDPYCYDKDNFEHTNFFIKNHLEIFSIYEYPAPGKYNRPDIQLALDTAVDLEIIRNIYARLYPKNRYFDLDEILELLDKEPEILKPLIGLRINRLGHR